MPVRILCLLAATTAATMAASAVGQTPKPPRTDLWPIRTLRFSNSTPLLGLPTNNKVQHVYCAADGSVFVTLDLDAGLVAAAPNPTLIPDLYKVTPTGDAAHLLRALPPDETSVSNGIHTTTRQLDFFVAEQTLATLIETSVESDRDTRPPDPHYFVSTSDLDGGSAKLTPLDLRFRPLKLALFGSGDFLILGWDTFNLQPMLVLVKDDGTVRRFLDLSPNAKNTANVEASSSLREAQTSARAAAALAALQHSAFVSYGSQIMLTYPGTTRPIEFLSVGGDGRSLPITYPGGYVLQQVFVTPANSTLVLRAQPMPVEKPATKAESEPPVPQRLLEYSAFHPGPPIREFITTKPAPEQVTCAPHNKLSAIFFDTLPGAAPPADGTLPAQVLVTGSAFR
jgi:hypothetical protein